MKEQLLEPLLRRLRIRRVLPILQSFPNCILLDIGCGWEARFLKEVEPYIAHGTGIDFKAPVINSPKLVTYHVRLDATLPFLDNTFDVVTMLAVLEHLTNPQKIVQEIHRILKNGGIFCGTVPSIYAKPILEFLSYKLGIVNPEEIRDHKQYYTKKILYNMIYECGFKKYNHSYFQLFMNNFFIATK